MIKKSEKLVGELETLLKKKESFLLFPFFNKKGKRGLALAKEGKRLGEEERCSYLQTSLKKLLAQGSSESLYFYLLDYEENNPELWAFDHIHFYEEGRRKGMMSFPLENLNPVVAPTFQQFSQDFLRVQAHLERGDCYQLNLTYRWLWKTEHIEGKHFVHSFLSHPQLPAYSYLFFDSTKEKIICSFSPECFFQLKAENQEVLAFPMKGTKIADRFPWDQKNQAELDMITDLMRHDLCRIGRPRARVLHRSQTLTTATLQQQYSVVSNYFIDESFASLIKALFPGGSITGAPKREVMKLIYKIESSPRGFYCGSSFIHWREHLQASINIRTFEWYAREELMHFGAGGGITLQSTLKSEWEEMQQKKESSLLQLEGTSKTKKRKEKSE
jgi:para-aminobenzoate synthetase component I